MKHAHRDDLLVIGMGLNALLESVRPTEAWWRVHGDGAALRRTRLLGRVILATRQKFFPHADIDEITEALLVADGLRDAARQCTDEQAALNVRLIAGAEVIERLCRAWRARP
jgi:hypothetical protein